MKKAVSISILVVLSVFVWCIAHRPAATWTEQLAESELVADTAVFEVAENEVLVAESEIRPTEEAGHLSAAVESILSLDSSFIVRTQQIDALGRNLSANDVAALRDFLLLPPSEFTNLSSIALNSVKNDVLEVLMDQNEMPAGLGQQIVDMFNDPASDYMWREYCLQFMQPFYERVAAEGQDISTAMPSAPSSLRAEEKAVLDALSSALNERSEDLAGTALLGLNRLAREHDDFDAGKVIAGAIEIAGDTTASDRCRLTALRVASSSGCADILPVARDLAQNAETDLLRGAAVTTLGEFGDPQDRELLSRIVANGNRQIRAAAQAALVKMGNSR